MTQVGQVWRRWLREHFPILERTRIAAASPRIFCPPIIRIWGLFVMGTVLSAIPVRLSRVLGSTLLVAHRVRRTLLALVSVFRPSSVEDVQLTHSVHGETPNQRVGKCAPASPRVGFTEPGCRPQIGGAGGVTGNHHHRHAGIRWFSLQSCDQGLATAIRQVVVGNHQRRKFIIRQANQHVPRRGQTIRHPQIARCSAICERLAQETNVIRIIFHQEDRRWRHQHSGGLGLQQERNSRAKHPCALGRCIKLRRPNSTNQWAAERCGTHS